MIVAIAVAGGLAHLAAWALVAAKRISVWRTLAVVLAAAGAAALATGRVALSPRVDALVAGGAGLAAGVALFAATRVVVALAVRFWPILARQVRDIYGQRGGLSTRAVVAASAVLAVGEEVFWRGLVQGGLGDDAGRTGGALLTWAAYVVANAPSANLPIVAGAVVGGAVWGAFAWWTGGVLGGAACHVVWTGLMVALPPAAARASASGRRLHPAVGDATAEGLSS